VPIDVTHFLPLSDDEKRSAKERASIVDYDTCAAQAKAGFPVRLRITRGSDVHSIYLTQAEALELHRRLREHLISLITI